MRLPGGRIGLALMIAIAALAYSGARGLTASARPATASPNAHVSAAQTHSCSRSGLRVVAQNSRGRVLRGHGYYGCLFSVGRFLDLDGGESVISHVRLRGRFVGLFEYYVGGAPHCEAGLNVAVFDLSRGDAYGLAREIFRDYDPRQPTCPRRDIPAVPTQVVLKENGAIAWIRCTWRAEGSGFGGAPLSCAEQATYEVVKHDARGNRRRGRVLASGPAIDPTSLRLRRGRISWVDGGRTQSARLR